MQNVAAAVELRSIIPLLFITIACGAISGFHGLVASGTTSKQLDCMRDARTIGYGGMLGEGTLAMVSVLAVSAGLGDAEDLEGRLRELDQGRQRGHQELRHGRRHLPRPPARRSTPGAHGRGRDRHLLRCHDPR